MFLSRDRAELALKRCTLLDDFRRGALRSFLSELSDDELKAMRIEDSDSNDEIAGFLNRKEKTSGDMILVHAYPCNSPMHLRVTPCTIHAPLSHTHIASPCILMRSPAPESPMCRIEANIPLPCPFSGTDNGSAAGGEVLLSNILTKPCTSMHPNASPYSLHASHTFPSPQPAPCTEPDMNAHPYYLSPMGGHHHE